MSVFELLGIVGLAVIAAYMVAWSMNLCWYPGLIRSAGGRAQSVTNRRIRASYVSETTPAYFQYVRRRYRYEVHCPVRYCVNGQLGEGMVIDMTREGWRVRGQGGVRLGTVLSMDLMLPGAVGAVAVSRAVVCWVRGAEFGVKLEAMDPQPASQLSEFFSTLPQIGLCVSKAA